MRLLILAVTILCFVACGGVRQGTGPLLDIEAIVHETKAYGDGPDKLVVLKDTKYQASTFDRNTRTLHRFGCNIPTDLWWQDSLMVFKPVPTKFTKEQRAEAFANNNIQDLALRGDAQVAYLTVYGELEGLMVYPVKEYFYIRRPWLLLEESGLGNLIAHNNKLYILAQKDGKAQLLEMDQPDPDARTLGEPSRRDLPLDEATVLISDEYFLYIGGRKGDAGALIRIPLAGGDIEPIDIPVASPVIDIDLMEGYVLLATKSDLVVIEDTDNGLALLGAVAGRGDNEVVAVAGDENRKRALLLTNTKGIQSIDLIGDNAPIEVTYHNYFNLRNGSRTFSELFGRKPINLKDLVVLKEGRFVLLASQYGLETLQLAEYESIADPVTVEAADNGGKEVKKREVEAPKWNRKE